MEPQLPTPSPSPEQGPIYRGEQAPRVPEFTPGPVTPERDTSKEAPSQGPTGEPQAPASPPPPVPAATPPAAPVLPQAASSDDDSPTVANDDDLIEKEWVEKAKRVIAETKHDPHLQEQAVSRLQADYLQKRYNKIIKIPSDG